jgi:hypothetical protein
MCECGGRVPLHGSNRARRRHGQSTATTTTRTAGGRPSLAMGSNAGSPYDISGGLPPSSPTAQGSPNRAGRIADRADHKAGTVCHFHHDQLGSTAALSHESGGW